ncbi:uncharacterized protein C9orf85 homolog [Rattus norvegicus]|uniref:uncharacterized protein C9orf85 homolog n=1 Tax=Rattus norvegicus TaxID=10116 RepID=UPI001916E308|nr:uncharacterized protein C9orf85 homolog [Rattus norvegicus]
MSYQKGSRAHFRPQAPDHITFKTRKFDSVQSKKINSRLHDRECQHCKVLEWCVQFNKYKPLSSLGSGLNVYKRQ